MLLFAVPVVFIRRLRYRPTLRVGFPIFSSFFATVAYNYQYFGCLSFTIYIIFRSCCRSVNQFFHSYCFCVSQSFHNRFFVFVTDIHFGVLFSASVSVFICKGSLFEYLFFCVFRDKWYVIFLRFFPVILGMFTVLNN